MPQNTISLSKAAEMTGRCDVNGTAADERSEYPESQIVHTNGLKLSTPKSPELLVYCEDERLTQALAETQGTSSW